MPSFRDTTKGSATLLSRLADPAASAARAAALSSPLATRVGVANEAWLPSLLILDGRALGRIAGPWCFVMAVTCLWTIPTLVISSSQGRGLDLSRYASAFALVLTTLSFLLVFRLNRSAERYWSGRQLWGKLVEVSRQLSCGAATHLAHAPEQRDALCAWVCAFALLSKRHLRGDSSWSAQALAGILSKADADAAAAHAHAPLFAASGMRRALAASLGPRATMRAVAAAAAAAARGAAPAGAGGAGGAPQHANGGGSRSLRSDPPRDFSIFFLVFF